MMAARTNLDLSLYARQNTVLLTSFKRDGTPVHITVDGERVYVRSYEKAWKTRRIRRDPHIRIAPSTIKGNPTGPAIDARARVLDEWKAKAASKAIERTYPILHRKLIPWVHRLMGTRTVHFEVEPIPAGEMEQRAA